MALPKKQDGMIRIKLPVHQHRPGPDYEPMKYHAENGFMMDGNYDVEVIEPFTPFEVPEKIGRDLVNRFGHLGAVVVGEKENVDLMELAMRGPTW